jgi:hypothetical protein
MLSSTWLPKRTSRLDKRLDDLKTEMIDQFEHVEKQFHATHDRLRDIATEIAVIHRRVERLEELGASNAGFAKEIDHLLTRVAENRKAPRHRQEDCGVMRRRVPSRLDASSCYERFANHQATSPIVCSIRFPLLSG